MADGRRPSILPAISIYLCCLVAYCAAQTYINPISVDLQDAVLAALPVVAAVVMWLTLLMAPPMALWRRAALGLIGGLVFGYLYFFYFKWVIVDQLHAWKRDEGLYGYLANVLGLLGVASGVLGAIAGCLALKPRKDAHKVSE